MLYLIHFHPFYKHAGHYLGTTAELQRRLREHASGNGRAGRLVQVAVEAGCKLYLARTWPTGGRVEERRLKKRHHRGRLCPVCCGELAIAECVELTPNIELAVNRKRKKQRRSA